MNPVTENANPKKNPVTNVIGYLFLLITFMMYTTKHVIPAFVILKAELLFEWYIPLIPLTIGIVLIMYVNDTFSERIFEVIKGIVKKKTNTESK